jgi:UDP-galactopyranose mutase
MCASVYFQEYVVCYTTMLENNHINMIFDYMQWIFRHGQEEVQTSKFMELISYMNRVERCFKETLSKLKLQLVIFKQVYNL